MATFLSRMSLLLDGFVSWVSALSSWMVTDILLGFCLALFVFHYVIKFFKKLRHLF